MCLKGFNQEWRLTRPNEKEHRHLAAQLHEIAKEAVNKDRTGSREPNPIQLYMTTNASPPHNAIDPPRNSFQPMKRAMGISIQTARILSGRATKRLAMTKAKTARTTQRASMIKIRNKNVPRK